MENTHKRKPRNETGQKTGYKVRYFMITFNVRCTFISHNCFLNTNGVIPNDQCNVYKRRKEKAGRRNTVCCYLKEKYEVTLETARNLFTRVIDHENNFRTTNPKSFMLKHQREEHQGIGGSYTANVTGTARDCLTRQVREAVHLRRSSVPILNSKTEWQQPALFRIQREILRG